MQLLRGGGASARRARRLEADLARNDAQPWARRILKEHLVSAVARRGGLAAVQAAAAAACKHWVSGELALPTADRARAAVVVPESWF